MLNNKGAPKHPHSVPHPPDPEDLPTATPDERDLAGEIGFDAADQERYRLEAYIDYQTQPDGRPALRSRSWIGTKKGDAHGTPQG